MLNTTRSRVRALAVVGMAAVTGLIGTVAYQASAAEIPAAAPAAIGPGARPVAIPSIPEPIKPPPGSRPIGAYVVAAGTQNYTCVVPAGQTVGAFTGTSRPEAQLIGTGGRLHHWGDAVGAPPQWQSERDGSLVVGKKIGSSDRNGAIPELLLQVVSHSGSGVLSPADYISRLFTSGGVAPTGSCVAGEIQPVAYHAVYVFWDAPDPTPAA